VPVRSNETTTLSSQDVLLNTLASLVVEEDGVLLRKSDIFFTTEGGDGVAYRLADCGLYALP